MIFESKYNIGDKVYVIQLTRESTFTPCDLCKGEGSAHLIENPSWDVTCPKCEGEKGTRIHSSVWKWIVYSGQKGPSEITKIIIERYRFLKEQNGRTDKVMKEEERISYVLCSPYLLGNTFKEHELWPSLEEAESAVKRFNSAKDTKEIVEQL